MQQIQDKIGYEWVRLLNRRLSKAEVGDYAHRLHHDEQGIASLLHALHSSKDKELQAMQHGYYLIWTKLTRKSTYRHPTTR